MNNLGKTVVAILVCLVIVAAVYFTRDFGSPGGHAGEGFQTLEQAVTDSIGGSYEIREKVTDIAFDDGVLSLFVTKDDKYIVSYVFLNRQKTKYYSESYYVVEDIENSQWHFAKNKVKTNYRLTTPQDIITTCDNQPVKYKDYTVTRNGEQESVRLYYNRVK